MLMLIGDAVLLLAGDPRLTSDREGLAALKALCAIVETLNPAARPMMTAHDLARARRVVRSLGDALAALGAATAVVERTVER